MNTCLNNVIAIDLHIHSASSEYKESIPEIHSCNKENLDVLLSKLQSNGVNMFSITDHNRFDSELYSVINDKINTGKYPNVYSVLPGIEFDVSLEPNKEKCHIIVIFNAQNDTAKYKLIASVIDKHILKDPAKSYTKSELERVLSEIGLDTILIAHQRSSFDRPSRHDSLGDATDNPLKYIGFIDALEYNKSRVEGILIDNLLSVETKPALLKGSDCHDWTVYPNHDKKTKTEKYFTKIRALPTFKGLLMALTSPETRFNRIDERKDIKKIDSISINGDEIEFSSGINAIIGENGAGKSTILTMLNNDLSKKYIKEIKNANNIIIPKYFNRDRSVYIKQAELINADNDNGLFNGSGYYKKINYNDFDSDMESYRDKLFDYIENNISLSTAKQKLCNISVKFENSIGEFYYVNVTCDINFAHVVNPYRKRLESLRLIKSSLEVEMEFTKIYTEDKLVLIRQTIINLKTLIDYIELIDTKIEVEITCKNIIQSCIGKYNQDYAHLQSQAAQEKKRFSEKMSLIRSSVVDVITRECLKNKFPVFPKPYKLCNENRAKGFIFKNSSVFSELDLNEKYWTAMFNSPYRSESKIRSIESIESFADAIPTANAENYKLKWTNCHDKFIESAKKENHTIVDESDGMNEIEGRTLGELSLIYYKYITYNNTEYDLLVIDQPEDNISNNRIGTKLIKFLNLLRDRVQVIFVTHNPILVVNLDVDNVIFMSKEKNNIKAIYGCLESGEILDLVSQHMDGGKKMIQRRLRVYGQGNEDSYE